MAWFFKGAVMGAADAVPGVSGGTMALITGIYERLIAALASFRPGMLAMAGRGQFALIWREIDGAFLVSLGAGILVSLFTVLNLVQWLLITAPPVLWAFFCGLIVASLVLLLAEHRWKRIDGILFLTGTLIAGSISFASEFALAVNPLTLVLGGALAISAMLLPGISGSFILLLLGLYPAVTEAVHQRDVVTIGWVALGCVIGLLVFSRFLQWLMARWHDRVMGFMLGFVMGALIKVWPWQHDRQWLMPETYVQLSGQSSWFFSALLAAFTGAVLVTLLSLKTRGSELVKPET
jgi:putative membrane protein